MNKKSIVSILILLSAVTGLFAHGKSDIEDIKAANLNSWQESFDLNHKKPGKYNIMITATDLGGNVQVEGPYNIWVDPKSDLPVCGITNPYPGMRVVANLNIVGTCIDDDGVSRVQLILDEGKDTELIVDAEGQEFWSYYLDTTQLEEGAHTIKVIGYDINEEPVKGNPTTLTWQLDRKLPLTQVTDREMGMLVSGKVNFKGYVSDGNGIEKLEYSTDNGEHFAPVKIAKTKDWGVCTFSVEVDTKKFKDGPSVLWFRATDSASSVGLYSFLYFIDNTSPDVSIVSPAEGEVKNGKFTAAGYAKDTIGITDLTWTFGTETGSFELIPGNPYWSLELDTLNVKDKDRKLSIRAVDKAGNIVEVSRKIPLNFEDDKPVTKIVEPKPDQVYGGLDQFIVRGIVTDDDAVKGVRITIDGGEAFYQETKGAFNYIPEIAGGLKTGKHSVTVTSIDVNDVEGNPVTTTFYSVGLEADFTDVKVISGKNNLDFVDGMEVHPESGSVFELTANSTVGIKSIHSEIRWGKNEVVSKDEEVLKAPLSYKVSLPISSDSPKGVLNINVSVTDTSDRVSEFNGVLYVTNTTEVKADDPVLVFDDSRVSEEGIIENNPDYPASGFLIGGKASKVELIPSTPFAKAELSGNQIKLVAGKAIGTSEPVKVRVTTTKGKVAESKPLVFKNDTVVPVVTLEKDENVLIDGNQEEIVIKGKAVCETGLSSVKYHILSAKTEIKAGVIGAIHSDVSEDYRDIEVNRDGSFEVKIYSQDYAPGVYVIEVVAESNAGNKSANAFAFTTIPEITEVNGKLPAAKAPAVVWLDGVDVYGIGVYQGELDSENDIFKIFPRLEMKEGANSVGMTILAVDGKAPVASKYTASKAPTLEANVTYINEDPYLSGIPVVLAYGAKEGSKVVISIKSSVAVSGVNYEITGDEVAGGDVKQTGSAKIIKPTLEEPDLWFAEIPLANLPVRVNKITAVVKAGSLSKTLKASVVVVREEDELKISDAEKVFAYTTSQTKYDEVSNSYILGNGSGFNFYANVTGPIRVELGGASSGLSAVTNGKLITVTADKEGVYTGVYAKVYDRFGDVYESERVNFIADNNLPEVHIVDPEFAKWLGNVVRITGTAADALGVKKVEYSIDNGETWKEFTVSGAGKTNGMGVTFGETVDISAFEDGVISIDVRATDNANHVGYAHTAGYKDVTPPEVKVVVPLETDVVNGETLIVFDAKDNAFLAKGEYVTPPVKGQVSKKNPVTLAPLTSVMIGTEENPIEEAMSFVFTDDAGNKTVIESWDFSIDNESDLPISEIHVPEEMQVITRDFTISGVVYDDDGDTTMFYKIDNGEYHQLPEMGTSFAIDVPLSAMTDNEHTVTVYAVDINGVKGPETTRTFRISLEEPKGAVELPKIETHNREIVVLSGWSSDKNGIEKVQVSLDNGNSYNDAVGTEKWSYMVDTRAIPGGTQVVFLKVTDKYGIQGLYSSLINIDNNAPELNLELPLDDSVTTGNLFFSGFTYDNVGITELYVSIRNLEKGSKAEVKKIPIDRVIGETIDISNLENGFYNVELTGKDKAGNVTNVSRNIHLDKGRPPATVDILYPLNGEHKNGLFTIYGQAESELDIDFLRLYVDGNKVEEVYLTDCGFFKFDMGPDKLSDGLHTYRVDTILVGGKAVPSREQTITYSQTGPWITIDNFVYGDFATNRPYIKGQAGYAISEDELLFSKTKEATPVQKAQTAAKKVAKVEISFDNGKTFLELSKNEKWMYRIENEDMTEGYHFFLVRATMVNGETAITRTIVQIDNTAPKIRLIAPANGGRYNQALEVSGLSNDDVRLEDVTLTLRKGDKASYEVPGFIQGLYVDFHFWGSTLFEIGAGLTFFDDNVKLQFQWGQFTQDQRDAMSNLFGIALSDMRYGGDNVMGVKLLANVISIPFSYFFGHDWDWLYSSVAVGAQFSWFNQTNSGKTQTLSAMLAQLEFPKVKLQNVRMFSTFSFYSEAAMWFIPTDVSSTVEIKSLIPQFAIGFRTNVF